MYAYIYGCLLQLHNLRFFSCLCLQNYFENRKAYLFFVHPCESPVIICFQKHHFPCLPWRHSEEFFLPGTKEKVEKNKTTTCGYVPKLREISSRLESPPSQLLKHHPDGWWRAGKITSLPPGNNRWWILKFIKHLQYFTSNAEVHHRSVNLWLIHSGNISCSFSP